MSKFFPTITEDLTEQEQKNNQEEDLTEHEVEAKEDLTEQEQALNDQELSSVSNFINNISYN